MNDKLQVRKQKKLLRQRLFYFLDVVGIDHLNRQQKKEFDWIVQRLGSTERKIMSNEFCQTKIVTDVDFTKLTIKKYYELLNNGYTNKEIGLMCGVSETTFYYWRKDHGLVTSRRK